MKKFLTCLLLVSLFCTMFAFNVSAEDYTEDDLYDVFSTIPASKHIDGEVKNIMKSYDLTQEQANSLMPLLLEVKTLLPKDLGSSLDEYPEVVRERIIGVLDRSMEILGWSYTLTNKAVPGEGHLFDSVLKVFDANGKLVVEYDGDDVSKTGETGVAKTSNSTVLYIVLAGIFTMLAGAVALLVVSKKRTAAALAA